MDMNTNNNRNIIDLSDIDFKVSDLQNPILSELDFNISDISSHIQRSLKNMYVFKYGIELEFNRDFSESDHDLEQNIDFIEDFLSNFQYTEEEQETLRGVNLEDRDNYLTYPIKHFEEDVYLTRFYNDGSVSDELVICSDNIYALHKVTREFNKNVVFDFQNEGQHISIRRDLFNSNRVIDYFNVLNGAFCLLEHALLYFNNQKHRNNDYSNNGRNPFSKDGYPALLLSKKVHKKTFFEFRFCNPKTQPFISVFLKNLVDWFNNVDIAELENLDSKIKYFNFDTREPMNIISSDTYRYIVENTELGKILNKFRVDQFKIMLAKLEGYNNIKNGKLTNLVQDIYNEFQKVREWTNRETSVLQDLLYFTVDSSNGDFQERELTERINHFNLYQFQDLPRYDKISLDHDNIIKENVRYSVEYEGDQIHRIKQRWYFHILYEYKPYKQRLDDYSKISNLSKLLDEFQEDSSSKLIYRVVLEVLGNHLSSLPQINRRVIGRQFYDMSQLKELEIKEVLF